MKIEHVAMYERLNIPDRLNPDPFVLTIINLCEEYTTESYIRLCKNDDF